MGPGTDPGDQPRLRGRGRQGDARVDPEADVADVLTRFAFVELDPDLASMAAHTGSATLRALDAIHVAAALRLGSEVDSFLTYDRRQARAAGEAGLRVLAPGRAEGPPG